MTITSPDVDARWQAVLAHRDKALRIARSACGNPTDAEDCVQEAMARVVALPDLDLARAGGLLAAVTRNLAHDVHRRAQRDSRLHLRMSAADRAVAGPEEQVCDQAEAAWLAGQLHRLPQQDRTVLQLRAYGHTVTQTAATLGITYKATEGAFTRARTALRRTWKTTLAVLGVLLGRPQPRERAVLLAAVTVALTAALAVVHQTQPPADPEPAPAVTQRAQTTPAAPPAATSAAATQTGPTLQVAAADPPAARPQQPPPPAEPAAASHTTTALTHGPIRIGPVDQGEVSVGREREDETMMQTVNRCLEHGVAVSLEHIGCKG